jgi:hypothetical protein
MPGGKWFNVTECNRRLLKIRSSYPSIDWITNAIPYILKSSMYQLGPLLWLYNCIWML